MIFSILALTLMSPLSQASSFEYPDSFGKVSPADISGSSPKTGADKVHNEAVIKPDIGDAVQMSKHLSSLRRAPVMRGAKEVELFKKLSPSVVLIVAFNEDKEPEGMGSGTIISDKGEILTNWHVVEGHEYVAVHLKPPTGEPPSQLLVSKVVKVDKLNDLALIQLVKPPDDLTPAKLATGGVIDVGTDVHAIGHPRGEFWTYTKGVVSQYREEYKWLGQFQGTIIQTQTPINPGNSGGPLLNSKGNVIGVNSFAMTGADGLNYAVAISDVHAFLEREGDREGLAPKKAEVPDNVKLVDRNKDGKTDAWLIDHNRDGTPDMVYLDENYDGKIDIAMADTNHNQKTDMEGFDTDNNGFIDTWRIDHNEDDVVDGYGIDLDEDGKIDRYHRP